MQKRRSYCFNLIHESEATGFTATVVDEELSSISDGRETILAEEDLLSAHFSIET